MFKPRRILVPTNFPASSDNAILEVIELIVMLSHARMDKPRFMSGSVAENVSEKANARILQVWS
jgi:hypothetical protein